MFEAMEGNGLHKPEFAEKPHGFITVSLSNTMVWDAETRAWLAKFKDKKLSQNQMRLLAMARKQEGRFTSAQYQKLAALDIYTASQDIKELIRGGLIRLEKKGGRVYRLAQEELGTPTEDFQSLTAVLAEKGRLVNADLRRIWGLDRQSALRRVKNLLEAGWLVAKGNRRGRYYVVGSKAG